MCLNDGLPTIGLPWVTLFNIAPFSRVAKVLAFKIHFGSAGSRQRPDGDLKSCEQGWQIRRTSMAAGQKASRSIGTGVLSPPSKRITASGDADDQVDRGKSSNAMPKTLPSPPIMPKARKTSNTGAPTRGGTSPARMLRQAKHAAEQDQSVCPCDRGMADGNELGAGWVGREFL
jgi:hypothetical protein